MTLVPTLREVQQLADTPGRLAAIVAGTAAVITALIVIGRTVRWVVRLLRKLGWFLDDFFGEEGREGVPARLGVMARLGGVESTAGSAAASAASAAQAAQSAAEAASAAHMAIAEVRGAVATLATDVDRLNRLVLAPSSTSPQPTA